MESEWVDFREIKRAVSIEMVLAHYNIRLRRVNRESLRGSCPLPTHSGKGEQSFCVQITKNVWACQSTSCVKARHGKKGGNVLDLVSVIDGCSIRDAALKLANWFDVQSDGARASPPDTKQSAASEPLVPKEKRGVGEETNITGESAENKPLGFVLKIDPSHHPYLTARGVTLEIASHFGVGFFSGRGSMSGRLVIPIHNHRGELVGYAGRAIDNTEPKYKFPSGFHKSELWNLHRVLALTPKPKRVIVVEGFFDAMKIHNAGYPHVVAIMGSALSDTQHDLLVSHFKGIVVMLDGDEAGKRATDDIALRLAPHAFVRVIHVPDGKQPDQLSADEFKHFLGSL
jgi:DNA primase